MSSFSLHIMLVMQKSHQKKKLDIEKGVECFKKFWWGLHVEWMLNESFWVHMSAHVISENDLNKSYLKQPGACSSLSYLPLSM